MSSPTVLRILSDQTILSLAANPQVRALFPCIPNELQQLSTCRPCQRERLAQKVTANNLFNAAKRCLMESNGAKRVALSKILNAKQVRFALRDGRKITWVTMQLRH